MQADRRSEAFRRYLADGLTRTLVGGAGEGDERPHRRADPRPAAARPLARRRPCRSGAERADVDVWIDPWIAYLRSRGVEVRLGEAVEAIEVRSGRIAGVTVAGRAVTADHYVAALPVEIMRTLLSPELRAAEPRLNGLDRLVTRWMNGIMFYLREDLPLVHGHAIFLDSAWALTSISQRQFWPGFDFPGSAACCRWTSPSGSGRGR